MPTDGYRPIEKPKRRRLDRHRYSGLPQAKRVRVIDPNAIEGARKPYCEFCRVYFARHILEVHHITARGMGGAGGAGEGKGDDVPENLICLCNSFGNGCHPKADQHKPGYTIDDMRAIVARRTS